MNGTSLIGMLGVVGTSIFSAWAAFRYVILGTYKLNGDTSKRMIDVISKTASWKWVLTREYVIDPKYPDLYEVIAWIAGMPLFLSRSEKLMTAGWKGKEDVTYVTFFRWHRRQLEALLRDENRTNVVTVSALGPGHSDRLGEIEVDKNAAVYLDESVYTDMEKDVQEVLDGKKLKTGMLLHGAPGNGKTQFIKYIAKKYAVPVNVIYLSPEYTNYDIARMFSEVPRRCIVLLEDFDNYFDGRECAMKNDKVNFTFDSIINALDGVHNDYRGVIFVMTANDINRIDDALKSRPSRFRFVKEFGPPTEAVRMRILNDPEKVAATAGLSLDKVFSAKK